jgi:hypothetical protein
MDIVLSAALQFLLPVAIIGTIGGGVFLLARNPMELLRSFMKQVAVFLGITVLLPLAVWYGTGVFCPPPEGYSRHEHEIEEQVREAKDDAEKMKLRDEKEKLTKEREAAERVHYRDMFYVAYPVGILALVVGIFFPVQAVGSGLMFGGLVSLAVGCYSYWDKMGYWMRFISLIVALALVIALGTWKFWQPKPVIST